MKGYFKNSSGFTQTIVLLLVCVGSLCFSMFVNVVYLQFFPDSLRATLFIQNSLPLFLTAVGTQYLISDSSLVKAFGLYRPGWLLPVIGILTFCVSGPLIEILNEWNRHLVLPEFLKTMEEWMIASEKQVEDLTRRLLFPYSFGNLMLNILQMGILAGLCEELLFRGVIQKIMIRWTGNVHAGIWIAAIIFSAIHLQFFGFVPRLLLGAMLGYLFALSGTLWVPVIAHMANNILVVITQTHFQDRADQPEYPLWLGIISFALICYGLYLTKRFSIGSRKGNLFSGSRDK